MLQGIENFKDGYQPESEDWQSKWRILIIVLLFSLMIIFALLAGTGAILGRIPRTTATFTFLLWIMAIIVMIVGAGKAQHGKDFASVSLVGKYYSLLSCMHAVAICPPWAHRTFGTSLVTGAGAVFLAACMAAATYAFST